MSEGLYIPGNTKQIENTWVITDNTTLTDAAIVFECFEEGRFLNDERKLRNWFSFLDMAVLNEVILADNRILKYQPRIQNLIENLGDFIKGIEQDDPIRNSFKQSARNSSKKYKHLISSIESFSNLILSRPDKPNKEKRFYDGVNSGLHRIFFYSRLSEEFGLSYSPSADRESILSNLIPQYFQKINARELIKRKRFESLDGTIDQYRNELFELSSIEVPSIKIPHIPHLVINEARKVGSWGEAIFNLRALKSTIGFRNWLNDTVEAVKCVDTMGLQALRENEHVLKLWADDFREDLFSVGREASVSTLSKVIQSEFKYDYRDPILNQSQSLLFFHEVFKAKTKIDGEADPYRIPL